MLPAKLKMFAQYVGLFTITLLCVYGGITAFHNAQHLLASVGIVEVASAAPATIEAQSATLQVTDTISGTVPPYLNYQGTLRDVAGNPMNGEFEMTFRVYHSPVDNDPKWSEVVQAVTVRDGAFSVLLGNTNPLPGSELFATPNTYLGVTVGGGDEMMPRQRLATVPYAYQARDAVRLTAPDGEPRDAVYVDNDGHVGVGTNQPAASLHVLGQNGWNAGTDFRIGTEQYYLGVGVSQLGNGAGNVHIRSGAGLGQIIFHSSTGDALTIEKDGQVGIGTQFPTTSLHVVGPDSNGQGRATLLIEGGGDQLYMDGNEIDGTGGVYINNNIGTNVSLAAAGGNVGVGTNSPNAKLDVHGTFAIKSQKPIRIFRLKNLGSDRYVQITIVENNQEKPLLESEWQCTVGGWDTGTYDHPTGNGWDAVYTYVEQSTWWLHANRHSSSPHENFNVDVVCFRSELIDWIGPKD